MALRNFRNVFEQQFFFSRLHPAQVIHHTNSPFIFISSFHCRVQYFIKMLQSAFIPDFCDKTLHEHSIQSILFHPSEMNIDSRLVIRRKDGCRLTIRKSKIRFIELLILRYLRPKIYGTRSRTKSFTTIVMMPSTAGTVTRGVEPPLITSHNQSFVRIVLFPAAGLCHYPY